MEGTEPLGQPSTNSDSHDEGTAMCQKDTHTRPTGTAMVAGTAAAKGQAYRFGTPVVTIGTSGRDAPRLDRNPCVLHTSGGFRDASPWIMRLTTRGRYAVTAVLDLALHAEDGPVTLADVAERQGISQAYLEQLFRRLKQDGLVIGARGPGVATALPGRSRTPASPTSSAPLEKASMPPVAAAPATARTARYASRTNCGPNSRSRSTCS